MHDPESDARIDRLLEENTARDKLAQTTAALARCHPAMREIWLEQFRRDQIRLQWALSLRTTQTKIIQETKTQ